MNQIIIVNKEKGLTSREVINRLNRILGTKKIGHTGTLDPIATGVLVVCVNAATKLCELLTSSYKEYIAQIKLGIFTDTLDITGNILKREKVPSLKEAKIINVLNSFLGKSIQEVPLYSAVKVKGKKLYEYARNQEKVKIPQREIEIKYIELLDYHDDIIKFKVCVSKGTYIRSLIKDICQKLNTIGTMANLIRTKQGNYKIEDSYTLKQIEDNEYKYLTIEDVLEQYPHVNLSDEEYLKIKNGALVTNTDNEPYTVYMYQNKAIAIYEIYSKDKTKKKPTHLFL